MAIQSVERLYKLTVDASKAQRELKKTNKSLKGIQGNLNAVGKAAKTAFALFGAGISVAFLKGLVETNSQLAKTADAVGLTAEEFQEFQFAAGRAGIAAEKFGSNMTAFVKRVGEAANNTGPLVSGLRGMNDELLKNLVAAQSQGEAFKIFAG